MEKNVMIVDDAMFMRTMLKEIFKGIGLSIVAEAENGKEAIELFKKHRPKLITMDIVMPDMDGITAVKEILKLDEEARIIMCSALGQEAFVMESIEAGARDFIVKPFTPDEIKEVVGRVMED